MVTAYKLYGMQKYNDVIESIVHEHDLECQRFGLRTVMTEGLLNAYKHGNKEDDTKPIEVAVETEKIEKGRSIAIRISDCGTGFDYKACSVVFSPEKLMMEDGRGMFMIEHFADHVAVEGNTLNITMIYEEDKE